MKNSNKYIIIICISLILLFGCSPSNIGLVDSEETPSKDLGKDIIVDNGLGLNGQDDQVKDEPDFKDPQEEVKDKDKDNAGEYSPPEGSFVLGEYFSPNELKSITLLGWHDVHSNNLQIDYIYWDWHNKNNKKLLTSYKENTRDDNAPITWLDNSRVLIEGVNLYNEATQKLKELLPDEVSWVMSYEVDTEKTKVAILGESNDYMGVWLIDLDTEYIQEVYLFDKDYSGELGQFRISWGADETIYFDSVDTGGVATIYKYKINDHDLVPAYEDAKLIDVDRKTGIVNYLHLESKKSQEKEIAGSDIEKAITEATAEYLNKIGFKVGNDPGEISVIVDSIFGDKAVVLYGFWSSEFLGEVVLKNVDEGWLVQFERQRYYLPYQERFTEASDFLAGKEGIRYGEEHGKSIVGTPYWNEELIVFLVGNYGEPWQWEYHVKWENNSWKIDNKIQLKGDMTQWWSSDSPTNVVNEFLKDFFRSNYSSAYDRVDFGSKSLTLEDFKIELNDLQTKMNAIEFDLGEVRIQQEQGLASVQIWFVGEKNNQHEIFYGRLNLIRNEGNWKISWPLNTLGI
ncbi:MAG: hypothetical protein APF76_02115 [Desulfitibacter sp. BRH_c19]|nr:MAG: hypothetical protein APF76_02115 [Desulfitibacter sp. BRH_c19]